MADLRPLMSGDKLNLEQGDFLLVDDNAQALEILGQALSAFGVRNLVKCQSAKEARELIQRTSFDFMLVDAEMPDETGYELLSWVRREASEPNRFAPAVLVTGHTRSSRVLHGRDCGAHFTVAKPVIPKVLLERIFWVAREDRKFVDCAGYVGPDRRFKREGPPAGMDGRRRDDVKGDLGEAAEPNLSQDEINSMMKPSKVAL